MITQGVRRLATALAVLCAATAATSLLVGVAAGVSAERALSGGFLVVGSLLFTAGAFTGLRDPARSRRVRGPIRGSPDAPATWTDAFHLSALLVGLGMCLVLLGVALHPQASF